MYMTEHTRNKTMFPTVAVFFFVVSPTSNNGRVASRRHTAVSHVVDFQGANDEDHLNEQRGKSTNWQWPEGLA